MYKVKISASVLSGQDLGNLQSYTDFNFSAIDGEITVRNVPIGIPRQLIYLKAFPRFSALVFVNNC